MVIKIVDVIEDRIYGISGFHINKNIVMSKREKEALFIELNHLLELLENNAEEKIIFLEDLINKIYYDQL